MHEKRWKYTNKRYQVGVRVNNNNYIYLLKSLRISSVLIFDVTSRCYVDSNVSFYIYADFMCQRKSSFTIVLRFLQICNTNLFPLLHNEHFGNTFPDEWQNKTILSMQYSENIMHAILHIFLIEIIYSYICIWSIYIAFYFMYYSKSNILIYFGINILNFCTQICIIITHIK